MTLQRTFLFLFLLLTSFIGCNEDPNIVGVGLLPKSDFSAPQTDTLYSGPAPSHPTGHATESQLLYTGYVNEVMLGKNADCEAWTLIKFYSWPDSLVGAYITSATIWLKPMYHFGDSIGTLSFDMYNATGVWTGDSLAHKDSLFTYPGNYYDPSSIGSAAINITDDTSWVSFNIPQSDTATLTKWFLASSDTNIYNQGLVLKPTNSSMIKGFYNFNSSDTVFPMLTVNYISRDGVAGTYTHSYGFSKYIARATPALQNKFNNSSDSLSYVQNGIAYRSTFYFDTLKNNNNVSVVFPSTVLVHRADIELTLNSAPSLFNSYSHDSLYAYISLTDSTVYSSSILLSQSYTNSQNQHVYKFKVNNFVQAWLKNPSMVKKVVIAGYNESTTFDRFALYGNNATLLSERPRLIITYSTSR